MVTRRQTGTQSFRETLPRKGSWKRNHNNGECQTFFQTLAAKNNIASKCLSSRSLSLFFLQSTGHKNNTAQPEADKWFSPTSNFFHKTLHGHETNTAQPEADHETKTAQPEADKCLSSTSHFSPFDFCFRVVL